MAPLPLPCCNLASLLSLKSFSTILAFCQLKLLAARSIRDISETCRRKWVRDKIFWRIYFGHAVLRARSRYRRHRGQEFYRSTHLPLTNRMNRHTVPMWPLVALDTESWRHLHESRKSADQVHLQRCLQYHINGRVIELECSFDFGTRMKSSSTSFSTSNEHQVRV